MIVYDGSIDDARAVIRFFRRESDQLRSLRKVTISPEKTMVRDVNRDGMEFPGLTYGSAVLEQLLREMGVIFNPETLHDPKATSDGVKEYDLTSRYTWGHDRVM